MTAVITPDPKQLVEAYKQGDAEAFDEIVRCYYEGLFTHAVRRLGDAHAAEDAVQETLVRAYGGLHRFNGEYHLRAWLHRILSNVCHDEGSRRQREVRLVERAAGADPLPVVEEIDDDLLDRLAVPRRQVLDALAALPEPYRRALVLRYVEDLSFREVADAAGITEGNARARVHRARAALKRTLGASVAAVVWLIPMLRRAERTAVADPGAAPVHAAVTASHASPILYRMAESGFADRVGSLAGSLGIAASLAVPVGVSHVADTVTAPPAPVVVEVDSGAAPSEPVAAASSRPEQSPATSAAPRPAASPSASPSTTAVEDRRRLGGPAAATATGAGAAAPAGSSREPAPGEPADEPAATAPGSSASPAPPPAAAPAARSFLVEGSDLTATSSWRTDLAGRVRVQVGEESVAGSLTGALEGAKRSPQPSNAADDGSGSTTTTTTAPPPESRPFSSELTLSLDDGRVVRLQMTGTLTDTEDGGVRVSGEMRIHDDVCGVDLGTAALSGTMLLREAPLASSLAVGGDGVALAEAGTSRSACGTDSE